MSSTCGRPDAHLGHGALPFRPVTLQDPPDLQRRRRPGSPLPWVLAVAAVVGSVGAFGVIRAADERTQDVERIFGLEGVLTAVPDDDDPSIEYPAENYLLVGSDSREGVDPNSEDFGVIGDSGIVGGRRSDTIMVLRQERNGGAALMSLPRDLWVEIAGTGRSQRINTAYNEGPELLAATVTQSLGIPIHHYVEVDFVGFKDIIDRLGGVEVCVGFAARDVRQRFVAQRRLPGARRGTGTGVRPQPVLRGMGRHQLDRPILVRISVVSNASSCSCGPPSTVPCESSDRHRSARATRSKP